MKLHNFPLMSTVKLQRIALAGLLLGIGASPNASADTWMPGPPTYWFGSAGVHLGASIAGRSVLGQNGRVITRLYVGAPKQSAGALAEAGVVQVYSPGTYGWEYLTTLSAALPQAGAHFGASLAFGGGHLVVGAPDYNDAGGAGAGAGRVEFFSDGGATPPNITLRGFRNGSGGNFGSAIAVDGNMAAVGKVHTTGEDGCVSAFHYDAGTHAWNNLPAANDIVCGSSGAALGASVAIRQIDETNFLLVAGAPGETQNGNALAGAGHVYVPNPNISTGGFVEVGTLAAQSAAFLDAFGTSVGIDANFIYVGATGRDNGVGRVGSVTIFKPASVFGYDNLSEYFPSAPATIGGHCGASLSVDPNSSEFILGCPGSTGTVANEGTARVYRQFLFLGQPVWTDSVLSFGNMLHGADALGTSVAIYGDHAFAGAPNANFPSPQTGNGRWMEFLPDKLFKDGFGG
jgi:hypothetical protein